MSKLHCGLSSSLIRMWRRLDAVGTGAVAEWLVIQVQRFYLLPSDKASSADFEARP